MGQQHSHQSSRDGETQLLLPGDAEEVVQEIDHDHDGCYPRHGPTDVCPANPYADLPVYTTIHRYETKSSYSSLADWLLCSIRKDIIEAIGNLLLRSRL